MRTSMETKPAKNAGVATVRSRLRAATGAVRPMEARPVPCRSCGGSGDRPCAACKGTGWASRRPVRAALPHGQLRFDWELIGVRPPRS